MLRALRSLTPALRPFHPALRPLGASIVVATALAGIAGASAPGAATTTAGHRPVPVSSPAPTTSRAATTPRAARVTRSRQRQQWVRPASGPVTSGFGRRWAGFHPGIDIGAPYGSPVRTITGGRIVSAGWIPGYGKTVRVRAHGLVFYYPHLSRILRRHGLVATGTLLGRVGSTGFSTGPHLHVEIRRHGRSVNPRPILRRHGVNL
jgi:murein DD-endopeptidase MepM/ murein hydrolase activator NlpD